MCRPFVMILGLGLLALTACSPRLTPFTQDLHEEFGWSESELKKIQFYVSRTIVLRREFNKGSSEIVSGKIKMVDGRKVEEVVIESGTPGVVLFQPKTNRLAVSFEEGSKERFLMFGPNPKAADKFVLLASSWDRNKGKVTYENKSWYTSTQSAYAALMVDLRKIRRTKVNSRRAGGRSVKSK